MIVTWVDGSPVGVDGIPAMMPVLDAAPTNHHFVHALAKAGHFSFHLEPNPSVQPCYTAGMGFIRKALVARPVIGNVVYAVANGEANKINPRKAEAYVDCHIEYIPAYDLTMISKDLGIQQWGLIRINQDTDDILSELPGPMAIQIVVTQEVTDQTKRHLKQWYLQVQEKLWVIK